ncbi:MAG TPA: hypothetical protein VFT52_00285 [Luteimonas sp.]|nr:hypothetical protein [Luteimonas sp.]
MSFDALIQKVRQAEAALEAQERRAGADWRQLRATWRALWTPGRLVVAGLAAGFIVGRAEPFKRAARGGVLQLVTALSGLFAGGSAQAAASEAGDAADAAQQAQGAPRAESPEPQPQPEPEEPPADAERRYREAGLP